MCVVGSIFCSKASVSINLSRNQSAVGVYCRYVRSSGAEELNFTAARVSRHSDNQRCALVVVLRRRSQIARHACNWRFLARCGV